jgi:ABC-2 type transport system permease protein
MSIPLFLKNMKYNTILLLVFLGLMSIYLAVIIYMYDPNGIGALVDMLSILPAKLVNALGLGTLGSGLTGFLASMFYGVLIYLFPMVYCIILGNRLVVKWVYDGSMNTLLATPNSRVKIIVTQGVYMLASIALMFAVLFLVGYVACEHFFPGMLDVKVFLKLNLGACLMTMAIGMFCFFFSCLFNTAKPALFFSSLIPVGFFLLNTLGKLSDQTAFLGKFSLYNAFDGLAIVNGQSSIAIVCGGFGLFVVLLFVGAVGVFSLKRLPV